MEITKVNEGDTGSEAAEVLYQNDKSLQAGQIFNPKISPDLYTSNVINLPYGSGSVPRVTPEGFKELYTPAGATPQQGTVCLNAYFMEPNKRYFFRMILKFDGFFNKLAENSFYFIWKPNNTGSNVVSVLTPIDLGDGRVLIERVVEPETGTSYIDTFGVQCTAASPTTIAAENHIICESVSIATQSEEPAISNDLTSAIEDYVNGLNIPDTLRIVSTEYARVLTGAAVGRPDGNGFTAPAGSTFNPSYIQVEFNIPDVTKTTYVNAQIRLSERMTGQDFYVLIWNPNAGSGRYVQYKTPVLIEGDLYKLEFPVEADEDNTGLIQIIFQQVNATSPVDDFTVNWERVQFWQNTEYTDTENAFNDIAVDAKISAAIEESLAPKSVNQVIASADPDDTEADFTGPNAVQLAINSITDASASNKYVVFVKKGIYKITNSSQFIGNPGYPAMVRMVDYIDVVGQSIDGTILWAELPYNDGDIDTAIARNLHQTVWNFAKGATMSNLTLYAKNIRYVIHQDDPRSKNSARYYNNVNMQFIGDKGSLNVFGLGVWDGEENYVVGGQSVSSLGVPYSNHNNTNFTKKSLWSFKGHTFVKGANGYDGIELLNAGSKLNDELRLENCGFGGTADTILMNNLWLSNLNGNDFFNHAEFRVTGSGNAPFLFNNVVQGAVLRIKTLATGAGQSVRFSTATNAYPILIKEPTLSEADIIKPGRSIKDGYIYEDGSTGLPAYGFGAKDVSTYVAPSDGVDSTSLKVRLGDCTSVNKILRITINGTIYDITFALNYATRTESQILAEINAVIGSVAVADLYFYGREYYPLMPDVAVVAYNESTTTPILKGTVVMIEDGRVKPCTDEKRIFGVALEDIPVYANTQGVISGAGRVMIRGYMGLGAAGNQHWVLCDNAVSTRFTVTNGILTTSATGAVSIRRAGVAAINC